VRFSAAPNRPPYTHKHTHLRTRRSKHVQTSHSCPSQTTQRTLTFLAVFSFISLSLPVYSLHHGPDLYSSNGCGLLQFTIKIFIDEMTWNEPLISIVSEHILKSVISLNGWVKSSYDCFLFLLSHIYSLLPFPGVRFNSFLTQPPIFV